MENPDLEYRQTMMTGQHSIFRALRACAPSPRPFLGRHVERSRESFWKISRAILAMLVGLPFTAAPNRSLQSSNRCLENTMDPRRLCA